MATHQMSLKIMLDDLPMVPLLAVTTLSVPSMGQSTVRSFRCSPKPRCASGRSRPDQQLQHLHQ